MLNTLVLRQLKLLEIKKIKNKIFPRRPSMQALQILRLALLWGPYSIVAPTSVTNWTGAGWLCRIYLTAALGIAAPLSSWFFLFLLAAGKTETDTSTLSLANKYYNAQQQHQFGYPSARSTTPSPQPITIQRDSSTHSSLHRETPPPPRTTTTPTGRTNRNRTSHSRGGVHKRVGRAFLFALLCTLPITLLQTGAAWVSYWVDYQGVEIEQQPRSLIGYFLATFWYGTMTQCDYSTSNGSDSGSGNSGTSSPSGASPAGNNNSGTTSTSPAANNYLASTTTSMAVTNQQCTLCTFPAASAIIHLLWTLIFLFALWTVTARIAAAALNRALQKRLRILVVLYTIFAGIGCACVGVSVVEGPFSWINQGVWLGYVATVAATCLLLSWEVVIVPVHSSHVAGRRALEWQDGDSSGQMTYAQAVVAAPDFPPYTYPYPYTSNNNNYNNYQQQQQQSQSSMIPFAITTSNGGGGSGAGGNESYNGNGNTYYEEATAPFAPLSAPYCHIELATHPPLSATTTPTRKSRSRLFLSRSSNRTSSRLGLDDDGGGGGEDTAVITARDVLARDDTSTSRGNTIHTGDNMNGGIPTLPSPFISPTPSRQNTYHPQQQQSFFNYRPSSAGSSTAGSHMGGRSSWPIMSPPSPTASGAAAVAGTNSSVAAVQLASYYQPHWQQHQQQRGSASAASLRPSTGSSSAPSNTISPLLHAYGGTGSGRINYSSSGVAAGGASNQGLGLFALSSLGGGIGHSSGVRYHNPSSSFGRGPESAIGTPTSSGTATPTPQSQQQFFTSPPWR
jgi:hypothetical protein